MSQDVSNIRNIDNKQTFFQMIGIKGSDKSNTSDQLDNLRLTNPKVHAALITAMLKDVKYNLRCNIGLVVKNNNLQFGTDQLLNYAKSSSWFKSQHILGTHFIEHLKITLQCSTYRIFEQAIQQNNLSLFLIENSININIEFENNQDEIEGSNNDNNNETSNKAGLMLERSNRITKSYSSSAILVFEEQNLKYNDTDNGEISCKTVTNQDQTLICDKYWKEYDPTSGVSFNQHLVSKISEHILYQLKIQDSEGAIATHNELIKLFQGNELDAKNINSDYCRSLLKYYSEYLAQLTVFVNNASKHTVSTLLNPRNLQMHRQKYKNYSDYMGRTYESGKAERMRLGTTAHQQIMDKFGKTDQVWGSGDDDSL